MKTLLFTILAVLSFVLAHAFVGDPGSVERIMVLGLTIQGVVLATAAILAANLAVVNWKKDVLWDHYHKGYWLTYIRIWTKPVPSWGTWYSQTMKARYFYLGRIGIALYRGGCWIEKRRDR